MLITLHRTNKSSFCCLFVKFVLYTTGRRFGESDGLSLFCQVHLLKNKPHFSGNAEGVHVRALLAMRLAVWSLAASGRNVPAVLLPEWTTPGTLSWISIRK